MFWEILLFRLTHIFVLRYARLNRSLTYFCTGHRDLLVNWHQITRLKGRFSMMAVFPSIPVWEIFGEALVKLFCWCINLLLLRGYLLIFFQVFLIGTKSQENTKTNNVFVHLISLPCLLCSPPNALVPTKDMNLDKQLRYISIIIFFLQTSLKQKQIEVIVCYSAVFCGRVCIFDATVGISGSSMYIVLHDVYNFIFVLDTDVDMCLKTQSDL